MNNVTEQLGQGKNIPLVEALNLAKAQAGVRVMTEDEILAFVTRLSAGIQQIMDGNEETETVVVDPAESRKSIRESSVTCLECGQSFKILTKRHLALHGLTPAEYREKWGLKKGTPLTCKSLQRERRKKMQEMQLWERRKTVQGEAE